MIAAADSDWLKFFVNPPIRLNCLGKGETHIPKIAEYRELSLDDLATGKRLTRTSEADKDIEELAESIRVQGLPIVVSKSEARPEQLTI